MMIDSLWKPSKLPVQPGLSQKAVSRKSYTGRLTKHFRKKESRENDLPDRGSELLPRFGGLTVGGHATGGRRPITKPMTATMRNNTNKTYAMLVAVPATPERPRIPAMIAMIRNVTAQLSMAN